MPVLVNVDTSRARYGQKGTALILVLLLSWMTQPAVAGSFNPQNYLKGSGYRVKADSMMVYQADSLSMDVASRRSRLSGDAGLSFIGMQLSSPEILLDWQSKQVEAWSEEAIRVDDDCGGSLRLGAGQRLSNQDPVGAYPSTEDTTGAKEAWPEFSDGQQTLFGKRMSLDLETRQGFIVSGRTAEDVSLYGGTHIKRVAEEEMHVRNAVFTTCDEDCPHFHFRAQKLKMLVKDKVFAKNVTLYFGHVPTLFSPVALFSLERGRASGLILPTYGETASEGRKLDHLGWYWAASQFWDTQLRLSYAENGPDWLLESLSRYVWNKSDKGNLAGSYNATRTSNRQGWDLHWNHSQSITPYLSLKAKVSMASSDDYYKEKSDNFTNSIRQNLNSSVQLAGQFPEQGIRWSMNATGNQDLVNETTRGQLPSLSLSYPTYQPMKGLGGLAEHPLSPFTSWLGGATLKLSSEAKNNYEMAGLNLMDADNERGARHNASLSFPGKLGVFSLTPSFSARSIWALESDVLQRDADGDLDTLTVKGFVHRETFGTSLSAATKLYGIRYLQIGRFEALRHVLSPTVSLNWTPDFSKDSWGYVEHESVLDSLGQEQEIKLDRFRNSIYGATPSSENLRMSLRLGQLFQTKWRARRADNDSLGEVDYLKSDLIRLTSSSSLDLLKDSMKLADVTTSWSTDPLRAANLRLGALQSLSISASTTHSPYHFNNATETVDRRYVWQQGPNGAGARLPRLTRSSFDVSMGLRGSGSGSGNRNQDEEAPGDEGEIDFVEDGEEDLVNRFAPDFGTVQTKIPWTLNLSYGWSLDHLSGSRRSSLRSSGTLKVTQNWSLSGSLLYNPEDGSFGSRSIRLHRDMHCWEGTLTWDPENSSYHLLVRVRSDMLQDLKWDKRRGRNTYLP